MLFFFFLSLQWKILLRELKSFQNPLKFYQHIQVAKYHRTEQLGDSQMQKFLYQGETLKGMGKHVHCLEIMHWHQKSAHLGIVQRSLRLQQKHSFLRKPWPQLEQVNQTDEPKTILLVMACSCHVEDPQISGCLLGRKRNH